MHKKSLFYLLVLVNVLFSFKSFSQKNIYAGIEIGSKGIKFSVIDVNNIKKGNYDVVLFWTENVGIAKGISIDGNLAEADITQAGIVIVENLRKIRTRYNVLDDNIFIVGSSGVAMAKNTDILKAKVKTWTNKTLEFIDIDTEGRMLLKGSIPPIDYNDSIILDIGGGNTKGGFVNALDDNKFEFFPLKLDYGTITLTEAINKTIVIPTQINDIMVYQEKAFDYAPLLRKKIKEMLESKPMTLNKKNIYLSGGAVWAFTTLYYANSDNVKFVPLKLEDMVDYDAILKNNFSKFEALAKTNKEAEKVINTYSQRHLIAANAILIACLESLTDLKSKKIYFAKEGQVAWLVSYIVERTKKVNSNF
ncbi:MAG: exopolyphosphatase [Flavobacterium sp.]